MNSLPAPMQSSPLAKRTTPALSPELTSLLDFTGSPDEAMRQIVSTPALLDEARAVLPELRQAATSKAGQAGIKLVIGKRFALYPQPARDEGEWAAWWADYFDQLADVSLAALEAGMRAHIADPKSEFLPKPGRLRELAFVAPCRAHLRYQRAARAVQVADAPPPQIAAPDAGEAARIKAMAAEAAAKLSASSGLRRVEMPSTAGKPDAGGLTQQMRAILARRNAAGQAGL